MPKTFSLLLKISALLLFVLLAANARSFLSRTDEKSGEVREPARAATAAAKSARDFCQDSANQRLSKEDCYAKKFREIATAFGPELSFEALNKLQAIDPAAKGCHLIAHAIGLGSYKRDPDAWRTLIQNMNPSCSYGAIHGVLESYIGSLPERSLKREVIPTICGTTPRADCNHIIGHMLLVETDGDVSKALDLCEVFKDTQQNSFCISGVFMEYQTALNLVAHELVPKSWLNWPTRLPELEKLCRSYGGKQAEGCWEEIVHVAAVAFNNDPVKIYKLCDSAQVPNGTKRCKRHSVGIMAASKNFNFPELKYICVAAHDDPDFERECYPMLVTSALSTIPSMLPEAVSFCKSLDEEFQPSCFAMIESWEAGSFMKSND